MKKSEFILLLGILFAYTCLRIAFSDFLPIWDGRIYFEKFIIPIIKNPFNFSQYTSFAAHFSLAYMVLVAGPLAIFQGQSWALHITNTLLGIVALCSMYAICRKIFAFQHSYERICVVGLLALNPVIFSNSINLNPDFGVFVFFLCCWASLLYKRYFLAMIFGVFLVLSKATGAFIYVNLFVITILNELNSKKIMQTSFLQFISAMRKSAVLFIPPFALLAFAILRGALVIGDWTYYFFRSYISFSWANFSPLNPLSVGKKFLDNLIGIFIVNWFWIFSLVIVIFLFMYIFNKQIRARTYEFIGPRYFYALVYFFLIFTFFLAKLDNHLNLRYFYPIYPLAIILLYVSIRAMCSNVRLRCCVLSGFIILSIYSNFISSDPLTKRLIGSFKFGQHTLYSMACLNQNKTPCRAYGRDQLVYNLEFVNFHYLQNKLYAAIKPDSRTVIVMADGVDWYFTSALDKSTFKRTLRKDNLAFSPVYLNFKSFSALNPLLPNVYYVAYPNYDSSEDLQWIKRRYTIEKTERIEHSGYSLEYFRLKLK